MLPPPSAQHPLLGAALLCGSTPARSLISGNLLGNVCGSPPPGPQHLATVPPALTTVPASRCTADPEQLCMCLTLRPRQGPSAHIPLPCWSRDGPATPAAWGTETQTMLLLPYRQLGPRQFLKERGVISGPTTRGLQPEASGAVHCDCSVRNVLGTAQRHWSVKALL